MTDLDRFSRGLRAFVREVFPRVDYYALYEFEVVSQSGDRLDVRPVDKEKIGFSDLPGVTMRPGLAGATPTLPARSRVLVGWVNGDATLPYIANYAPTGGPGGTPEKVSLAADELELKAGAAGASPTEHATSSEAVVNLVANAFNALGALLTLPANTGTTLTGGVLGAFLLSPANATWLNAAIAAAASPTTGTVASFASAISAALAAKSPNVTGLLPSVGWPDVRGA